MEAFAQRMARAWSQPIIVNQGRCMRCHLHWEHCKPHDTGYRRNEGVFALCTECWKELTPEQRVVYYRALFLAWKTEPEEVWLLIQDAVLRDL